MANWIRFSTQGKTGFGTIANDAITVYRGDMFDRPEPTDEVLSLKEVTLLTPIPPTSIIGLWNNFHARANKEGLEIPEEPLYFLKPPSCFLAHGEQIRRPAHDVGRIIFEAELGVVMGRSCHGIEEVDAATYVFGYTCVNDVSAIEIIQKDSSFEQWTRAKGFDSFGVIGPHITTGIDPSTLTVKAVHNGRERQNYPVSDMVFSPLKLVSLLSHAMTLRPGDVIACGTSLGVRVLKDGDQIDVVIDGIGTLSNIFAD